METIFFLPVRELTLTVNYAFIELFLIRNLLQTSTFATFVVTGDEHYFPECVIAVYI